jgi:MFS transporter, MFS domain-containing protein family, molybdate-anion transporter
MPLLLVGRVLGGLSTSLLFSAFESWMVAEHRRHGFPESWLASTFGISAWANGFMAICAGIFAQVAAGMCSLIPPNFLDA